MDGNNELVVVVEDDQGMQQALQRLLHASGYLERSFGSVEACIADDGLRDAACLVLDVYLPGVSGTELYTRLGSGRPPAVFITSHDTPALRRVAGLLGAAVVTKPFHARDLLQAIAAAIAPP